MDTYLNDDFVDQLGDRVWLLDNDDDSLYKELFQDKEYKIVKTITFKTDYYEDYTYYIKLLEKVGD